MKLYVEVAYASGLSVRRAQPNHELGAVVIDALQLADDLGRTFSDPIYGLATDVRVLSGETVTLSIRVILGGLLWLGNGGLVAIPN
jgi:hypothetical protein